jgi:hypothetical protein
MKLIRHTMPSVELCVLVKCLDTYAEEESGKFSAIIYSLLSSAKTYPD